MAASVQYWSSADATGQPAGSQSISGPSSGLKESLPRSYHDIRICPAKGFEIAGDGVRLGVLGC